VVLANFILVMKQFFIRDIRLSGQKNSLLLIPVVLALIVFSVRRELRVGSKLIHLNNCSFVISF
jgi:hypothetical protein